MQNILNFIKHIFTPTHSNNYRAKALHTNILVMYLFIALALSLIFSVSQKVLGVATDISISKLVELVNQKRAEHGLSALAFNEQLSDAARRKASGMLAHDCWAHFCDGGVSPWTSILESGYVYDTAGENLAKDFCCSSDVVNAWMDSPTHRDNILRSTYKDVGFAVVNGNLSGGETTLVVQMFGSPRGHSQPKAIVPEAQAQDRPAPVKKTTTAPTNPPPSAVPSPTIIPATPTPFHTGVDIVSASTKSKSTLLYTWAKQQTSDLSFLAIVALALALICDLYYAYKLDILRLTGKSIAHLLFVGVSLVGFLVIARGSIL